MVYGSTAYTYRIKTCTFQKDGGGFFSNARIEPAKNSGNTHRFIDIANHQILILQFATFFIQCNEGGSCREIFYFYMSSFYCIHIKGMQGLTTFMQYIIGNIYHV